MFKKKKEKQTCSSSRKIKEQIKKELCNTYWRGYCTALQQLKNSVETARVKSGIETVTGIHWEGAVCIALALAQEKLEKVVQDD